VETGARRSGRLSQLRERRARYGEWVHIDGSPHDWFEGRGPRCAFIVFIDDATGRLVGLRFVPSESTKVYLEMLRVHGRPVALLLGPARRFLGGHRGHREAVIAKTEF
jgi:hypothetical protein